MEKQTVVERMLDMLEAVGVTPADLLREQMRRAALSVADTPNRAPESVQPKIEPHACARDSNNNTNTNIDMVDSDSGEIDPHLERQPIEVLRHFEKALRAAGKPVENVGECIREWSVFSIGNGKKRLKIGAIYAWCRRWMPGYTPKSRRGAPASSSLPIQVSDERIEFARLVNAGDTALITSHEHELTAKWGAAEYQRRVQKFIDHFGCQRRRAQLAVHGSVFRTDKLSAAV